MLRGKGRANRPAGGAAAAGTSAAVAGEGVSRSSAAAEPGASLSTLGPSSPATITGRKECSTTPSSFPDSSSRARTLQAAHSLQCFTWNNHGPSRYSWDLWFLLPVASALARHPPIVARVRGGPWAHGPGGQHQSYAPLARPWPSSPWTEAEGWRGSPRRRRPRSSPQPSRLAMLGVTLVAGE